MENDAALNGNENTRFAGDTADGRCIFTFEGHTGAVTSVCVSRDGKYILSGSVDETVKLWDIAKRKCMLTLRSANVVHCVEFSPDGKHAASVDGGIKIWGTADGTCVRTIEGFSEGDNAMCLSPDGKNVIVGNDYSCTIQLWDLETKKVLKTFKGHTSEINSLCSDGKYILSGSEDWTIKLWDISKGKCMYTFEDHTNGVMSVCFSPDGKKALSGSRDRTVRYWDIVARKCTHICKGHQSYVNSVCLSPDGKKALSGSLDKTIKYWDLSTGVCIRTFEDHSDHVNSVCFAMDGSHAVSGSSDKTVKLWALPAVSPAEGVRAQLEKMAKLKLP